MHRVLVVGDAQSNHKAIAFRLASTGFDATSVPGELACVLRALASCQPDAIVFDCAGDQDQRDLFELLHGVWHGPIMIVGEDSLEELVWYLEAGATDYAGGPVTSVEVAARLRRILRRSKAKPRSDVVRVGDLLIDVDGYQVRHRGRIVSLTRLEFRLLLALAKRAGRVCTHAELLAEVWGEEFAPCIHYVRLYIGYLRKKLEDDPRDPQVLATEWGVGYRLTVPAAQPEPSVRRMRVATA